MIRAIITLSILFQLSATILALRLIVVTKRTTAWLLLAAAIALMTVRRAESFVSLLSGRTLGSDLFFETVGLVLSALMCAGVYSIRPLFGEIVRAGDELRDANSRLRALSEEQTLLLEHTRDFIYRHDVRGIITYISPAVERITGYTPAEWRDHFTTHYTDNRENQAGIDLTNEMLRTGKATPSYRVEVRHKNGGTVWLEVNKQPYLLGGVVAGVIGVARDITGRVALEAEKEKLIGDLQAALANVNTLSGLLPICSSCKKIRDDQGYWQQLEAYMHEHADIEFTHGMCPDCMKKIYPAYHKP